MIDLVVGSFIIALIPVALDLASRLIPGAGELLGLKPRGAPPRTGHSRGGSSRASSGGEKPPGERHGMAVKAPGDIGWNKHYELIRDSARLRRPEPGLAPQLVSPLVGRFDRRAQG